VFDQALGVLRSVLQVVNVVVAEIAEDPVPADRAADASVPLKELVR
jgi:hypothetical protein